MLKPGLESSVIQPLVLALENEYLLLSLFAYYYISCLHCGRNLNLQRPGNDEHVLWKASGSQGTTFIRFGGFYKQHLAALKVSRIKNE